MLRTVLAICLIALCIAVADAQTPKPAAEKFEAAKMSGESVSLADLRGKVVVLTFWSTRCVICHGEIPKLNRMSASYKGKDVVFLAITMENPAKVEAYIKDRPFDFEIIPNGFGILLKYAARDESGNINMPYPTFFVIGPGGSIELKTEGVGKTGQMSGTIDRLLSSTAKNF